MALATVLAIAITAVRWLLWRHSGRSGPAGPDWPAQGPAAHGRRTRCRDRQDPAAARSPGRRPGRAPGPGPPAGSGPQGADQRPGQPGRA